MESKRAVIWLLSAVVVLALVGIRLLTVDATVATLLK